jgi:GNAT superfamily N-acetyltransferase
VPSEEELEREQARMLLTDRQARVLALLDGDPVGAAGFTVADGVLRLWGGAVREEARGRGVYRSLLAARLARGVEGAARMALVKGRVQTSAPILRRVGFEVFGQERSYAVPLG